MTTERRYDIDWLRVIAIGLLLIYHIAIVFQPWAMLIGFIRSNDPMEGLWVPMTILNVWRIPFLFFVSGMGVWFAIRKRNWQQLLLERTKRIFIPFIFGILAIVPLHQFVFQKYYEMPLTWFAHPAHLWFLGNIFIYVLLLLPLFIYIKKKEESRLMEVLAKFMRNPAGPLSISLFFILETLLVKPPIFELYAMTWHGFYLGLLAFFFGFLLVSVGEAFWQTALCWRWLYAGLAATLYGIRLIVFDLNAPEYLMAVESICWIMGVFGFGYKYLNKPGAALNYLSRAAYPVYIIHMFVLYLGVWIILPLTLPVMLKFVFIVAFTGVGCYVIYEFLIRRIGILRPLFGLKWKYPKQDSQKLVLSEIKSSTK